MDDNILGCFVSSTIGDEKGSFFRKYLWGDQGIVEELKKLKYYKYGKDLKFILLQFYVNPEPQLLQNLQEIEDYRKKEKSIGVSIIIDGDNFFSKTVREKYTFLTDAILLKLDLIDNLSDVIKLDTNISELKKDVEKLLVYFIEDIYEKNR